MEKYKKFIEDYIRPRVNGDGGEIEFVDVRGDVLMVNMLGECSKCPIVETKFKSWLESELKREFSREITVEMTMKKPYFIDI